MVPTPAITALFVLQLYCGVHKQSIYSATRSSSGLLLLAELGAACFAALLTELYKVSVSDCFKNSCSKKQVTGTHKVSLIELICNKNQQNAQLFH